MQTDWLTFLNTQSFASNITDPESNFIAPLTHLSVLSISGEDAALFLQGQTTCDIYKLELGKAQLGALCNAKGRTISTFIIIKQPHEFQLILTTELLPKVQKKLQLYILRAKVTLTDCSDAFTVIGLKSNTSVNNAIDYPDQQNRYLIIAALDEAQNIWNTYSDYQAITTQAWLSLDIDAGIPWLFKETTEEFVPQMLNLDTLNAISFEKGCYTGQEIVARTHYLGKNKRSLTLMNYDSSDTITLGSHIISTENPELILGTVVLHTPQKLLAVLKDEAFNTNALCVDNPEKTPLTLNQK